jgi:hypothetical protein
MNRYILYILLSVATFVGVGCESEYKHSGDASALVFASDTLSFDTIFTGEATPTTYLALYNRSDDDILIDRIYLAGGDNSYFNVNINGVNATSVENIRLQGNDSLWIFVNVFPRETTDDLPFVVEDVVSVTSGTHVSTVRLLAYAQNAVRLDNARLGSQIWTSQRPYLLSGHNVVDSGAVLTINEGTKVYFTEKASLDVYGSIVVCGTQQDKVLFKGMRNDEFYDDIPGQWRSIMLMAGSTDNYFMHAEIAGGQYAVEADSASSVEFENVMMRDASYGALLAYGADVSMSNTILCNCGGPLVAAYGGSTLMIHCTLSNYFSWEMRRKPTLMVCSDDKYPDFNSLLVANSIIVGNLTDEVDIDSLPDNKTLLSHCYIKLSKKAYNLDTDKRFETVRIGSTPYFVDREKHDYRLTEKSEAVNNALPAYAESLPYDYEGNSRLSDICPDMGALEYISKTEEP